MDLRHNLRKKFIKVPPVHPTVAGFILLSAVYEPHPEQGHYLHLQYKTSLGGSNSQGLFASQGQEVSLTPNVPSVYNSKGYACIHLLSLQHCPEGLT